VSIWHNSISAPGLGPATYGFAIAMPEPAKIAYPAVNAVIVPGSTRSPKGMVRPHWPAMPWTKSRGD